jgi:hypothetical protein
MLSNPAWPPPHMTPRAQSFARMRLSDRDRAIVTLACHKLGGATVSFGEALRALREAVSEQIPAGRTYFLGSDEWGPIVGSIVSGVGIVAGSNGVLVVHVGRDGGRTMLGRFAL